MINAKVLNMIGGIDPVTYVTLNCIRNQTCRTEDFDDLSALDDLYNAGWINGYTDESTDDCMWILTDDGRKLLQIIEDIII
jgi:hypothetical protein